MSKYQLSTNVRPGDVIGFSGLSSLDRWICYSTMCWPGRGLAHVGMCTRSPLDNDNGLVLFESTMTWPRPCMYAGQVVHGPQFQPLEERIYLGQEQGSVWLFRLRQPLTDPDVRKLTALCIADCGKAYDVKGAIRARKLGLGWLARRVFPKDENPHRLFCSEAIAIRLRDLGRWDPGNASEWDPDSMGWSIVRDGVTCERKRLTATLVQGA